MNFKRLLLFLAAPLALVMSSCVPEEPVYTTPSITITDAEGAEVSAVNFAAENPEDATKPQEFSFTITATRGWTISKQAEWLGVTPLSHTNATMEEQSVDVKISVGPNDGDPRSETLKIVMDKIEKQIVVSQAGVGQTVLGEDLYYDNFDKVTAVKDGNFWPCMGAEYGNPTPESQSGVTYASSNVTVRSNSNSDGSYSDYEGSGANNIFFGKTPNYLTISGISLAALEGNSLTLTFGTEKYSQDNGSTFTESEFHVYISGDGAKWSEIDYTFAGTADGRWNLATAQFNLKEVPESVCLAFVADVASSYRLDDVKLTAGGGGAEIDLSQGGDLSVGGGGSTGGDVTEPDPNAEQITVAEFIEKADTATTYQLTGTISGSINTTYGNFDLVDESGSIYIYGLKDASGANVNWSAKGLNKGDVITVQGKYYFYAEGNKHEIKDALYISHTDGEDEGGSDTPIVAEGAYASDAAFVCATDDSANAAYGLGATTINGSAATGFKLGKSKQEGKFTSKAIGVEGDKYLNFYAVSWGAGGDKTIYFRVNSGEVISQDIKANSGANNNPPYNDLAPTEDDLYSVKLTGLSASDVIEFSTNAAFDCATTSDYATRAIFFGVKLTDEPVGEGGGNEGGEGGEEPEPEDPEDPETPEEPTVATIASIVALGEGATVAEGTFVEGVVISNSELNNLTSKKGLYIQDETAGLQFYCGANHSFKFGDKVKVDLSGQKIAYYNGAVQISGTTLDKFEVLSSGNAVEAKTVTMADFLANKYEGQYIALEGVQVVAADLAKTWGDANSHISINMEDAEGNTFVVFSSKYASYGAETVAQGSGTIKGISSINKGTMQIIFAQATDYAGLTGERFGDDNTGEEPEDPELAGTGEGTLESPYDVVRAKAAIDAYTTVSNVYVKGIVTATATKYNSTYKSCDYYISVDGTTDNELMVYSGKFVDGADFTSADQIHAGDEVVVCGNLKKYNSTYEFDKTSKIVSLVCNHEDEPEQPANAIALPWMESFDSEDLSKYTIVDGGSVTKVYPNDKLAGGEAGEILIGKNTGSMTANIASDGSAQTLNLWFKSNYADRVTVTSATTGVTLTKVTNTGYTVEVAAGVEVFALTLSNTNSSNVRVDDIVLTAEEPTIESISVSGAQVLFTEGDDFATGDDFTVTAILQNGATKDVTANVTVDSSAVDMTTAGTYTVTVSYDNISTTYNVTVQAAGVEIVTTSFVFKEMGYSNAEDVASVTQDGVTIDFALGTNTSNNSAKYYNTGEGVRTYVGNTITVSCDGDISAIDFKFAGDSYNKISADGYSGTTWSGSAKEVVFDSTGTTRIQSITVTYAK